MVNFTYLVDIHLSQEVYFSKESLLRSKSFHVYHTNGKTNVVIYVCACIYIHDLYVYIPIYIHYIIYIHYTYIYKSCVCIYIHDFYIRRQPL